MLCIILQCLDKNSTITCKTMHFNAETSIQPCHDLSLRAVATAALVEYGVRIACRVGGCYFK